MHSFTATVFRRWVLLGLLVGSLGACQRASYQFQPIASTATYQAAVPMPMPESALVTVAAPPTARLGEGHRVAQRSARRLAGLPRALRVVIPLLPTPHAAGRAASAVAPAAQHQRQESGPVTEPVHSRSRTVAILLAILSITYLPLSLHNFYLGYYGRGALAIALFVVGVSLTVLGLIAGIFSSGGIGFVGAIGFAMFAGWFVWQCSDLIRIITKDLQPKNGSYRERER